MLPLGRLILASICITSSFANGVVKIPFVKKASSGKSAKDILESNKARFNPASAFVVGSTPATNLDVLYTVTVKVGSQTFNLIVDTGSSNMFIGTGTTQYRPGTNSKSTGNSFALFYGSGQASGMQYTDTVTIGGVSVVNQSFGNANASTGFVGMDGLMGFGPVALTKGTVQNNALVPTFMDNLKSQGVISTEILGLSFAPESGSDTEDVNGELTLGGTDATKYVGSIAYSPLVTTSPWKSFWSITVSSITLGNTTLSPSPVSALVDSGTTFFFIPAAAYSAFLTATKGQVDSSNGLTFFQRQPTANLTLTIGGAPITLTPAQYLVPKDQYFEFGLTPGWFYSWISNGQAVDSFGVDFILGLKFLENVYCALDTTNAQVGFAQKA